jgi:hypothetical protein
MSPAKRQTCPAYAYVLTLALLPTARCGGCVLHGDECVALVMKPRAFLGLCADLKQLGVITPPAPSAGLPLLLPLLDE